MFSFLTKSRKKIREPRKRKKRKEVFKFHFWVSFLIVMSINVLLIIFVKEWRYYFLFWDYSVLAWLNCLVFPLIYAFCRVVGVKAGAGGRITLLRSPGR